MRIFADLHIHSRHSRATSKELNIKNLEKYAKIKGVNLLGTGDFTHPEWLKELKQELTEENGILKTKTGFPFILSVELSSIYKQDDKTRKIHNVILAPSFEVVDQINDTLDTWGRRDYDGRPIFGKSCIEIVEMCNGISKDTEVIPAHVWTPWFGLFGSMSGFDSVEEAFGEKSKYIHALETGLSCYDSKTEVLTINGWKKVSDVKQSTAVCTLNIENNKIEFQHPTKLHKYKYKGKMYKLKNKRIDLLVTPNHKLLVSHCDFRKPPLFSLKEAESVYGKSKRFKKDGLWYGKNVKHFTLPAVKIKHGSRYYSGLRVKKGKNLPIEPWLKFFGFWIAEGWTTKGKNGDYNVCVSNKDKKLIKEMKGILESFGYKVSYNDKNYTLRLRNYQLFNYLKQFGKCADKFIPKNIKSLSKELLEILLKYYIKGDGHIYGRTGKGLSATTTSTKLRDDLQEIALKIGMSAYYKLGQKKGTPFKSPNNGKIYKQREDVWVIYFIRQNIHTVMPSLIKKNNYIESWVGFNDYVYCVSVPNKVVYVRRNGIPVWCGNSDPEMNWRLSKLDKYNLVSFSDLHSFWPWRIGREATIFDTEMNYDSILNGIRTGKGLAATVEVNPAYGKYHWDGHRNCKVCMSPNEALKANDICPVCRRKMTIGVEHRVEYLADREPGFKPEGKPDYYTLLPLSELISSVTGIKQLYSKKINEMYYLLADKFGSEFTILLETPKEELEKVISPKLADLILKNRKGAIEVKPGYDGVYGEAVLDGEKEQAPVKNVSQKSLLDF